MDREAWRVTGLQGLQKVRHDLATKLWCRGNREEGTS